MAKLLTGTRVYGTANVDNVLAVGNVTPVNSTSNTTGSLVVTGGAGITGNVHVGNVIITGTTSNGITFADGTRQTTAATGGGGGGASPSGYLANTIIVANSAGFLSNSNISFSQSNNATIFPGSLRTTGSITTGGVTSTGSVFVGSSQLSGTELRTGSTGAGGFDFSGPLVQISTGLITYSNFFGSGTASQNFLQGAIYNNFTSPSTGNVVTLFVGNPVVQASANTVRVSPYAIWSNGSIYVANNITVNNGVEIVSTVFANNTITQSASVVVNDITNQFDNFNCVFNLRSDQSNVINIMNSRNLEVIINGAKLAPYVGELRFPWLTPYDSFKGYRVRSSNTRSQVVIYNPPAPGDQAILTLINSSSSPQNRRYPYSAATIALGD
jgi:hypothetical protein